MIRLYDGPLYQRVKIEAPLPRAEAMKEILTGLHAATEMELGRDAAFDRDAARAYSLCRYFQWAGYQPYRAAAPLGQQHLTHVRLRPAVGTYRFEYVFPGGLLADECDDLCLHVIGEDNDNIDQDRECLVTSTLAGVLHGTGVSLADQVIAFARGQTSLFGPVVITPTTPPTRLCAAVRDRGWSATVEWLRDTQATFEQALNTIRDDLAVWVPEAAPRLPWEPLILRCHDGQGWSRLALGTEADAYKGVRVELAVSDAELPNWWSDREAQQKAQMSQGEWRRWIETHREVRIGRPITRSRRLAQNRRLIHRGDLQQALRLFNAHHGEEVCRPMECRQRCIKALDCPHRGRDCPRW